MIDRSVKLECHGCHKLIPTIQFYDHLSDQDSNGDPRCSGEQGYQRSISNLKSAQRSSVTLPSRFDAQN